MVTKVTKIEITSFIPLSEQQLTKLIKLLPSPFLSLNLPVDQKVNKRILGGFKVRIGDWFLDASLASDLLNIKKHLLV